MNLDEKLEKVFRLDINQKKALSRLGLFSIADLLFYFPTRYSDISEIKHINTLVEGDNVTIYGKVSKLKTKKSFNSGMPMAEGIVEDLTGKIKIIWYHQAYLAKMIKEGSNVKLTGKVTEFKSGLYLANPEIEHVSHMPIDMHDNLFIQNDGSKIDNFVFPIYNETRGVTSKWIYHAILKIFSARGGSASGGKEERLLDNIQDYIPEEILQKYNLPSLRTALIWMHTPKNKKDADSARKRFAFEEVFFIQLKLKINKHLYQKHKSFQINTSKEDIQKFLKNFPFNPTNSQINAIDKITEDMNKDRPMTRLLEGDVGSGKTLVAATASYLTVNTRPFDYTQGSLQKFGNLQTAYMAPTEILATQLFENFIKYFTNSGIAIGLITGSGCRKFPSKTDINNWTSISRVQLLKWVANGEIPILIGTHALIQKSVRFKYLALSIIDEQHRFGINQRKSLTTKNELVPHLLSMTATPIPRTLALTIYGDLDLTLLEEMPAGRKKIITEIITPNKRDATYEKIKKELEDGRQLYV
ncbi:MAG: DEAD/DEAH box helicase, partial [bacterium]|nr:DEAD/DEAH box helicase [bacterium]